MKCFFFQDDPVSAGTKYSAFYVQFTQGICNQNEYKVKWNV